MATTIDADTLLVASPDQLSTELADEAIILGPTDGTYYGLAGSGLRIWQLLQEPRTPGAIARALVQEFDVEPAVALADVLALCDELRGRGLVVHVAAA